MSLLGFAPFCSQSWAKCSSHLRLRQLKHGYCTKTTNIKRNLRSAMFVPIRWETPQEAVIASHRLLIQAGFIDKIASGIYTYLPLAQRSISKIIKIIDEEMESVGGQKLSMPKLLPKEMWLKTGRWDEMGKELIRLKDRKSEDFCLAPTHEEVITTLVSASITSHRSLPLRLYQIGDKYRDEARPRFGLLRGREFIMKDLYSFDATKEAAEQTYQEVLAAYKRVMDRLEFPYAVAEADSGNIGGNMSHEVHALTSVGEDKVLVCPNGHYYANLEKAKSITRWNPATKENEFFSKLIQRSNSISDFLKEIIGKEKDYGIRLALFSDKESSKRVVIAITETNYEANPYLVKPIAKLYHDYTFQHLSQSSDLESISNINNKQVDFVIDDSIFQSENQASTTLKSLLSKYSNTISNGDIKMAKVGDQCKCSCPEICFKNTPNSTDKFHLQEKAGIEVGHCFYLGTKYSTCLEACIDASASSSSSNVTSNQTTSASSPTSSSSSNQSSSPTSGSPIGKSPMEMGCYGIGVSRLLAVCTETSNDEHGIIWSKSIAPYLVNIIPSKSAELKANEVYDMLQKEFPNELKGEVFIDDRHAKWPIPYRMKESRLIGIPYMIVLGNDFMASGNVEIEVRKTGKNIKIEISKLVEFFKKELSL